MKYLILLACILTPKLFAEAAENWIISAKNIIQEENLTDIKLSCIELEEDKDKEEDGKVILITAYELHSPDCKGDPDTSPRLFFIEFNLIESLILSDAKSPCKEMEVIKKIE